MKRNALQIIALFSCAGVLAFATISKQAEKKTLATGHDDLCQWSHYAEVSPTNSTAGAREYWICCDHSAMGPVFAKPTSGTITNKTHDSGFVAALATNDARRLAPYKETEDFERGFIPSYISVERNANLSIASNEGIDGGNALKITNTSWNYGVKWSKTYLDQIFSDPEVVALNFYAKSSVTTCDFRRLAQGKAACYELNSTGWGINDLYKEFSYTRAYYEGDYDTDCLIYGGVANGTSIYIDNVHPVKKALNSDGFECGALATFDATNVVYKTAGHSSSGVDNYVAAATHFRIAPSSGVITSAGYSNTIKNEGERSAKITKGNGYMACYLPTATNSALTTSNYVAIDIYSTVAVRGDDAVKNLLDGFNNSTVPTKVANKWQTYTFARNQVTNDGRFLIIQGSSAGDFYFDNIRFVSPTVHDSNVRNAGTIYRDGTATTSTFETTNGIESITNLTIDGTAITGINNTRKVSIAGSHKFAILNSEITAGEKVIAITYISGSKIYTETIYATIVDATLETAISASVTYGDSGYTTLSGKSGVYRILCGNKEFPYQVSGSDLLIPNSALIEVLPNKTSGQVLLTLCTTSGTTTLPINVTVSGTAVGTIPTIQGEGISSHAYSSSSSYTTSSNYETYLNNAKIAEYQNTGIEIWYEQALHFGVSHTTLPAGLKYLLNNANKLGTKVMISDDFVSGCSKIDHTLIGEAFTINSKEYSFASTAELDAVVENRLNQYINYPACYGIPVGDEQYYKHLIGGFKDIMDSLHRVLKKLNREDFFLNANLNPMQASGTDIAGPSATGTPETDYTTYLTKYLEVSGLNYVQFDSYPLVSSDKGSIFDGKGLNRMYLRNIILAAEFCKANNLELRVVTQSLTYYGTRVLTNNDIAWLNNMLMSYGVSHVSFFVYCIRANTGTESWLDNSAPLSKDGNKTDIYYYYQGMMGQINTMGKIISAFDYKWSYLYKYSLSYNDCMMYSTALTMMGNYGYSSSYGDLSSVTTSSDWVLATGLTAKDNSGLNMYSVQNVFNKFGDECLQTVKLTFKTTHSYAVVYEFGLPRIVKMNSKTLTLKLSVGHAAYVLPY